MYNINLPKPSRHPPFRARVVRRECNVWKSDGEGRIIAFWVGFKKRWFPRNNHRFLTTAPRTVLSVKVYSTHVTKLGFKSTDALCTTIDLTSVQHARFRVRVGWPECNFRVFRDG